MSDAVFVNIGAVRRAAIAEFIASQGLCQSDIPALKTAANRFVFLTEDERKLPKGARDKRRAERQEASLKAHQRIAEVGPKLKPRRTVTDVVNAALDAYLERLEAKPDVKETLESMRPGLKVTAR